MTRWQRRARFIIAVFAVVFAAIVARQLKPRPAAPAAPPVARTDSAAIVESTRGRVERFNLSHENLSVSYDTQLGYADGSAKLFGVTLVADEQDGEGRFRATSREATIGKDESTIVLNGDVRVESSEIRARTEQATYTKNDNTLRAPGAVELTEGRTSAKGVGMTFDRNLDVIALLAGAVVHMGDESGGATDVTCDTATFARRDRYRRFEKNVHIQRGPQVIEADTAVAYLSEDEKRIDTIELRGGTRITAAKAAAGALQGLSGRDITLKYAPNAEALEHAVVSGDAVLQVAGEQGKAGPRIAASLMDIALASDGSTPTALLAREGVQLTMPPEPGGAERTITAPSLDAKGEAGRGLTRAVFSGTVQYRERGANVNRVARSGILDVGLKAGMGAIEDARFVRAVRFEEGKMTATAAAVRYDPENGTLELSGSEAGATVPRVVNDQIAVDAATIDVTLEGPKVIATGTDTDKVKSVLQPARQQSDASAADLKMPSMLKQDQPVNVTGATLDYDGTTSTAVYDGSAQLWQGDTVIKGETLTIDGKAGDLAASAATTTTTLEQTNKETKKKERVRSLATATDLKYEDALRRLTYTGEAHMTGSEGDMTAEKIELYLKPSGDELERAEAYDDVTLREQNRTTTGTRMTYTTADERYVIVGAPVKIVDQCDRQTTGKTLTFLKATDSIVVDGNQQTRTQTKGGGKCP